MSKAGTLIMEDGTEYLGRLFGAMRSSAGEVVFNTGMVGYPESLTDPSYRGQILTFTYPLIGNYGVPPQEEDDLGLSKGFESTEVQVEGMVVSSLSSDTFHWSSGRSLDDWMESSGKTGIAGVDTRSIARRIRERGAMLGKIVANDEKEIDWRDPNLTNLVADVSVKEPREYGTVGPRVVLIDMGTKASIIRSLVTAGTRVLRVPWDYDFFHEEFSGLCISNGPGNPRMVGKTVSHVWRALEEKIPTFGVCLGNQILALAAGAETYKLRFGHRSQNQPCLEVGTPRCSVTSQNHGYAVDGDSLPEGWRQWFVNANDSTNEGIRHDWKPARSVQFHPEATPGPTDTKDLFHRFVEMLG